MFLTCVLRYCSFLFVVSDLFRYVFLCSRLSFVDVPLMRPDPDGVYVPVRELLCCFPVVAGFGVFCALGF